MLSKIVKNPIHTEPPKNGPSYILNTSQRMELRELARYFESGDCGKCYQPIADDLNRYLDEGADLENHPVTVPKKYKDLMAKEVVGVTCTLRELRLARLIPSGKHQGNYTPYRGVFVKPDDSQWSEQEISYVFTTSHAASNNTDDIDKHVSLEVEWRNPEGNARPQLSAKRWMNGLYFFDGYPRREVVFPWPASFLA